MSRSHALPLPVRRVLGLALVGLLLAAAAAVGTGRIGYHVTDGVSMEPAHHAGDLVVVARTGSYRSGDIAAYRTGRDDGVVVLHRIIGGDAATGYVIKGDNNQSVDPVRPSADELIGREVLHLPGVGGPLQSPLTRTALLGAVLVLLGALTMRHPTRHPSGRLPTPGTRARPARAVLVVVDVVVLVALALTFAVTDPAGTAKAQAPAARGSQTGSLAYAAAVPVTDTYPAGEVRTGDPVFVKLRRQVDVTFRHTVADAPGPVRGTARLDVEVVAANGWRTTFALAPSAPLADGALETTATLDVGRIQALAAKVTEQTGLSTGTMTVTVRASTRLRVGDGELLARRFDLPFQLTPLALTLSRAEPRPSPDGPVVTSTAPLQPKATRDEVSPDRSRQLRLALLAVLLVSVAATVAVWPGRPDGDDGHRPRDPAHTAAAELRDLKVEAQLAELRRVQLADRAAIDALGSAIWRLVGEQGRPSWAREPAPGGSGATDPTGPQDS